MADKISPELESKLAGLCDAYIEISQRGEEARRRDDKIGGRLWQGHHWIGVSVPKNQPAITANVTQALIHHKVSIMVKQMPMPIVEAAESGDQEAAEHLRNMLIMLWKQDDLMPKVRKGLIWCNCTRTSAGKVMWDSTLRGGIGDITTYMIPGPRLILDGRVQSKDLMTFCGDRAVMTRAKAMALYPKASKELEQAGMGGYTSKSPFSQDDSPIPDPWDTGRPRMGGKPALINNKAVFTVFAGEQNFGSEKDDMVEVVELYHKDLSYYEDEEVEKDTFGNELHEIMTDPETGEPMFSEAGLETMHDEYGPLQVPTFTLMTQPRMKKVLKRKYPMWRRTTSLLPGPNGDRQVLDDRAWDLPLPYFFLEDTEPMEGIWSRGCALQLETPQAMLNVSLSTMMRNLMMGSTQAFLADPQANLQNAVLFPKSGQVIPAPPSMVVPLQFPQLSPEWFNWINSITLLMERIVGATGVMQGESQGRLDSAVGYDLLAEIGGSRIVECTQRMEDALADWAKICISFAQKYYTEEHAIKVEDKEGNVTYERAWGTLLAGNMNTSIETGSSLAWSESAKMQRYLTFYKEGIIDKPEFFKRIGWSGWREMVNRMLTEPPQLAGAAGAPPPRTRQSVPKTGPQKMRKGIA